MPLQESLTSVALPVRNKLAAAPHSTLIFVVNSGLLALVLALLLYYVLSANGVASSEYQISSIREELARANTLQTELSVQISEMENSSLAADFAASNNMVPAKDTSYIFENGNVALGR